MGYEVIWTKNGFFTFEAIYHRILAKWGERAARKFEAKVDQILDLLEKKPSAFQSSDVFPHLKKVLVSKQTTLFFELKNESVILLSFWENARNPDSLSDLMEFKKTDLTLPFDSSQVPHFPNYSHGPSVHLVTPSFLAMQSLL